MEILVAVGIVAFLIAVVLLQSITLVGPAEVGLVNKRFSFRKLRDDNPVAFRGEAGYQSELLMPGLRFKLWPLFAVKKNPWVQIPAGEIGVVLSQIGDPLPAGNKSAIYRTEFASFTDLQAFLSNGGQKGVQRPVLPPGALLPIHPVAFLVVTTNQVYGVPVAPELAAAGPLDASSFGLAPEQLRVVVITPQGNQDVIGIVTTLEGDPLPSGDIASRLGGYSDIAGLEARDDVSDSALIEVLLGSKNNLHNNYQNYQAFLDHGGHIGLQHDPLLYGAYLLNPFLVQVELAPMLVVQQGEVAVIKSYVGLPTLDTSGAEFKFGSIVQPGHRGIWRDALRTGKYPINPRVYAAERVPTSILTLNWANQVSLAHNLDAHLSPIEGKSREGFIFTIDLQVQIHVPDTKASKVISMVGTMQNLVNEVLQSAVGNHFRNTLQSLEAVRFIETRQDVQKAAFEAVSAYLAAYEVETRGVYIQDVIFPQELVEVLTRREIANQERTTYEEQERAQRVRVELEKSRGTADMQAELAQSQVSVGIKQNQADARKAEAQGEAAYVTETGRAEANRREAIGLAEATATEALGLARATGYRSQVDALGTGPTAAVAIANAIAEGGVDIVPDVLVTGGGGALEGLAATFMANLRNTGGSSKDGAEPPAVESPPEAPADRANDEPAEVAPAAS
jgi:regulator of protease activity HflC (stomatin/prohibitin superfamily)